MGWSNVVEWTHVVATGALVGSQLLFTLLVWMRFPEQGDGSAYQVWRRVEALYRRFALVVFILGVVSGALLLRYTLISPELYQSTPYGRLLEVKVGSVLAFGFLGTMMPRAHAGRDGASSPRARRLSALNLVAALTASVAGYMLRYV